MPTPLDDGSIIQIRFESRLFEQKCLNVFHYQADITVPVTNYRTEMDLIIDDIVAAGAIYDRFLDCLSATVKVDRIVAQPVYADRLAGVIRVPVSDHGTQHGTDMPVNTAAVITKQTDVAARYGIGSVHLPGMLVENLVPETNLWEALQLGFMTDFANVLFVDRITANANYHPVLWNIGVPNRATRITASLVQDTPRVERRRTLRVGR